MKGINVRETLRSAVEAIPVLRETVNMFRALKGGRAAMIPVVAMVACADGDKDTAGQVSICKDDYGYEDASAVVGSSCVRTYCENTEQGTTDAFRLGAEALEVAVSGDGQVEINGLQLEDMDAEPLSSADVDCLVAHDLVAVGVPNTDTLCDQSYEAVYTVGISTASDSDASVNQLVLTATPGFEEGDQAHTWYMFTGTCSNQVEWPYGGTEQEVQVN